MSIRANAVFVMISLVAALLFCGTAAAITVLPEESAQQSTSATEAVIPQPPMRLAQVDGPTPMLTLAAARVLETDRLDEIGDWNEAGSVPIRNGLVRALDDPQTVRLDAATLRRSESGSWVWGTEIHVDEAHAVRLRLDDVELPHGAQLWVWGPSQEPGAPFGTELIDSHNSLWTPPVFASTVWLEVELPAATPIEELAAGFTVSHVGELFELDRSGRPVTSDRQVDLKIAAEECLIEAVCLDEAPIAVFEDYKRAVARLQFFDGGFSGLCSGALLADGDPTTDRPYLLTANHCFATDSAATSLTVYFDYHRSECGGAIDPLHTYPVTSGGTLLATSPQTDVTMVELNSVPANRFYLGWTTKNLQHGTELYRISHPSGRPQHYSASTVDTFAGQCSGLLRPNFVYSRPTEGGTIGGSSGAPTVTVDGLVIGQLLGGCGPNIEDPCDYANAEVDGALSRSYGHLADWLGLPETPALDGPTQASAGVPFVLTWDETSPDGQYQLSRATVADFSDETLRTITDTQVQLTENPEQATTLYFRVRATLGQGTGLVGSEWSNTLTVAVSPPVGANTYTVAGIARAPGAEGTNWRSSLAILNRSTTEATLELRFFYGDQVATASTTLAPNAIIEWEDVVSTLFGVQSTSAGSVVVASDVPVHVTARTFNQSTNGTFGQFLPGEPVDGGLGFGDVGLLPQLKSNDAFRTNVGFVNLSDDSIFVRYRLYDATGQDLGMLPPISIGAHSWFQVNDAFAGEGIQNVAYATVEMASAAGRMWAYGSVVDELTGDPTTVPVLVNSDSGDSFRYMIAGIAHAPGAPGTNWRSNVAVTNRSGAAATITVTYHYGDGSMSEDVALGDGEIAEWEDVAVSLFGLTANSSGSVSVTSDQPLLVTARTFNESAAGTFGQYLPGVLVGEGLTSSSIGLLPQLKRTDAFRTNIGFVNLGDSSCQVRVRLYDASGTQVGGDQNPTVPANGWFQINRAFQKAGAGTQTMAWATVEVLTEGGQVWAYGSVVDEVTGDPTTIPVVIE